MIKRNIQRKWKRSLISTQCGKTIEEELTYKFFAEHVGWEWFFNYNSNTIDIAWHEENGKAVYELNINGYNKNALRYKYDSPEELLEKGRIYGKTIQEIWEDLEN